MDRPQPEPASSRAPAELDPIKRIVVRGVNWLGDAVMSTPALLRLREALPGAAIALVTPQKLEELWQGHPAVDQVIPFSASQSAFAMGRHLRAEGFDTALVLPNSFRSAWEFWWAGIPSRIGYAGQLRSWLLTRPVSPHPGAIRMRKRTPSEIRALVSSGITAVSGNRPTTTPPFPGTAHHIHQYLHLAAQLGADPTPLAPQLFVTDAEAQACLDKLQVSGKHLFIGLNAGAEYGPAKRWPAERFIAVARLVSQRVTCAWLIFGGSRDNEVAEEIARGIAQGATTATQQMASRVINLAGRTSLRELCGLLKLCRVLLTNDTGPMHVAAAVGTPVVVPFGSTSPELTGPGYPGAQGHALLRAGVPCAPCFRRECPIDLRCLTGISAEVVADAVLHKLLLKTGLQY